MTDPKLNIDLRCKNCGKPMTGHPRYCFPEERIQPWLAACGLVALLIAATVGYVAIQFIAKRR